MKNYTRKQARNRLYRMEQSILAANRIARGQRFRTRGVVNYKTLEFLHVKDWRKVTNKELQDMVRKAEKLNKLATKRLETPPVITLETLIKKSPTNVYNKPFIYAEMAKAIADNKKTIDYVDPESKEDVEIKVTAQTIPDVFEQMEKDKLPSERAAEPEYEQAPYLGRTAEELDWLKGGNMKHSEYQKAISSGNMGKALHMLNLEAIKSHDIRTLGEMKNYISRQVAIQRKIEQNIIKGGIRAAKEGTNLKQLKYMAAYNPDLYLKHVDKILNAPKEIKDYLKELALIRLKQRGVYKKVTQAQQLKRLRSVFVGTKKKKLKAKKKK